MTISIETANKLVNEITGILDAYRANPVFTEQAAKAIVIRVLEEVAPQGLLIYYEKKAILSYLIINKPLDTYYNWLRVQGCVYLQMHDVWAMWEDQQNITTGITAKAKTMLAAMESEDETI